MIRTTLKALAASTILSGAALAADLPSRSAPPVYAPIAPVFTWSGFHVGTVSGYAFSDNQRARTFGNQGFTEATVITGQRPRSVRVDHDDLTTFGGGIGYDYQFNPGNGIVVGVAADATLMDQNERRGYIAPAIAANGFVPEASAFRHQLNYLATVRGRVGYAFDRVLVYGTGGFAFGEVDQRVAFTQAFAGPFSYLGRRVSTETGYAYGGGIEYAIPTDSILNKFNLLSYVGLFQSAGVTVKAEYLRYDLGRNNVQVNSTGFGPGGSYTTRFETEGNLIRGGFTYRFGTLGIAGL